MPAPPIITIFGSSRPATGDPDYEEARVLGSELARRGFVICTGGYGGVMEAASRGAKEAGGRVLAVTANFFSAHTNAYVDEEIRVETWQERLFALIERGAGYVACKGGTGTLVELAVVWEMLNKRAMPVKPFVVLGDFWQPVIARVRDVEKFRPSSETVASPRWGEAQNDLIHLAPDPASAASFLAARLL